MFGLSKIKQKYSYLNTLDILDIDIEEFDVDQISIRKGYKLNFIHEEELFMVETAIDFFYQKNKKIVSNLFGVTVELEFHLQNFGEIIKWENETTIDAPDDLIVNLISITYSTARGILYGLTANSDYENVYLPLTDPGEFQDALQNK
jgi:hypothetical protein